MLTVSVFDTVRPGVRVAQSVGGGVMNWIKVSERLPEKKSFCIIYAPTMNKDKPHICTAYWDGRFEIIPVWAQGITHWMPLPDPPTEEN